MKIYQWMNLLFVVSLQMTPIISYTISTTINPIDILPHQFPNNDNKPNTFVRRYYNGKIEQIKCPFGSKFDELEMKCIFKSTSFHHHPEKAINKILNINPIIDANQCDDSLDDYLIANPDNCRTFFNCGHGYGYLMDCAAFLLFNNSTKQCDYPLEANCCEYQEENPNQIVQ